MVKVKAWGVFIVIFIVVNGSRQDRPSGTVTSVNSMLIKMYKGKVRRNRHTHGFIHLEISVRACFYNFVSTSSFSMKDAQSFMHEAPSEGWASSDDTSYRPKATVTTRVTDGMASQDVLSIATLQSLLSCRLMTKSSPASCRFVRPPVGAQAGSCVSDDHWLLFYSLSWHADADSTVSFLLIKVSWQTLYSSHWSKLNVLMSNQSLDRLSCSCC